VPTTLGGLLLFVVLLVPGFIHYVQRRSTIPQRELSPLVETATLATVSIATNGVTLGAFGLLRMTVPRHTPETRRLLLEGSRYAGSRLGYLALWGAGLLLASCALAFALSIRPRPLRWLSEQFTPAIVDVSAWYHVFEEGPDDASVYVGCELKDGTYFGGTLEWYSTEVAETADRDVVLAAPITLRPADGKPREIEDVSRLVISARELSRVYVSYVAEPRDSASVEASA
jgi:hypothetical protein